ncbi:zinc finger protein 227-like [Culicoides brevitarsis]|uniref:zinc finger protein 227-like n=1 Tax=Culicoides brevitarsis TaxID=469753 RepID=UPI00307C58B6
MIMTYKMKLHIQQTHERKLNFKCDICKKGFRGARDLQNHLASKHLEKKLYKCSICDISVSSSGHLKRHIDSVHERKVVGKCKICAKTFIHMNTFRIHLKKHEKIEYFTCNLVHHLKIHQSESLKDHPDSRKCKYCPRYFLKENLREHYQKQHKPRKCEDCGKVYFNEMSFIYHKKTHEEPKFTCDICGQKSPTKLVLKGHMETIHLKIREKSKCEICNKMIMTYKMKLHIQQTHERKLNFKCDICKKGFRRTRDLQDHLALKHLEKELYKCSICDISVSSKGHLKRHITSVHERKVVGKCEICAKTFIHMNTFRSHLKKHEKIEYFICDLCKRSFSEKGNLRRHMKIHLN